MLDATKRWLRSLSGSPAKEQAMPPVVETRPYIDPYPITVEQLPQEDMPLMTTNKQH